MMERKFKIGDRVRKHSGSWWEGRVVGFYDTVQTSPGYNVQLDMVPNGPVQIYPEAALETATAPMPYRAPVSDEDLACWAERRADDAGRLARELIAYRRAGTPTPSSHVVPDYCYDPNNWEFTVSWKERDQVHGYGDALNRCELMEVATLIRGPLKWVADVPVTWDEHGDPDETEVKWFDSEEEARAALATAAEGK